MNGFCERFERFKTAAERSGGGGQAGARERRGGVFVCPGLRGEEVRGLHGALQRRPIRALIVDGYTAISGKRQIQL